MSVRKVPRPAILIEFHMINGTLTCVTKALILVISALPKVTLPTTISAVVLVAPITIQMKGNTEMKAASPSRI